MSEGQDEGVVVLMQKISLPWQFLFTMLQGGRRTRTVTTATTEIRFARRERANRTGRPSQRAT